ncbi:hypothetical protein HU200_061084 [Digitaria exilis]|uniref:F-box domain-containing protein n=1 Tax=Digitaria exilis TaxID=1010633 RepID=A0A835A929_9POAL|nr:hypothetical protein HU200_061084 [Digitaria exilis]
MDPPPPKSILDVPDDLLRLIFLRLDSPLWLIRAACTCKQFRHPIVSAGGAFLRLAATLHPPAIVGHYDNHRGRRVMFEPSSPSSAPIDVGRRRRRLSFDFLPRPPTASSSECSVADCHGGLVLLRSQLDGMPDLIVCDPLTRRYQGIHRPYPPEKEECYYCTGTFLLDGDDGSISVSNFRVMYQCRVYLYKGIQACVFNSAADGDGWSFPKRAANDVEEDYYYSGDVAGRGVDGSIYLGLETGSVKILDSVSLQVSKVDLPIHVDTHTSMIPHTSRFTVVHGAGPDPASPASTWIIHLRGEALEFFRLVHGSGEWVLEHTIPDLSEATRRLPNGPPEKVLRLREVDVIAGEAGTAILSVTARDKMSWLFSIDMAAKKLQVVPTRETYYRRTRGMFAYALPWPRFLRACRS